MTQVFRIDELERPLHDDASVVDQRVQALPSGQVGNLPGSAGHTAGIGHVDRHLRDSRYAVERSGVLMHARVNGVATGREQPRRGCPDSGRGTGDEDAALGTNRAPGTRRHSFPLMLMPTC
jgi:hypothetical protein